MFSIQQKPMVLSSNSKGININWFQYLFEKCTIYQKLVSYLLSLNKVPTRQHFCLTFGIGKQYGGCLCYDNTTTGQKICFYPFAMEYCRHVYVCLSVHLSIILDCGQQYIPQPHFICQIIDTDVLFYILYYSISFV